MWSSSHMYARPWLEVAVMTRAPAAEAPTQALIAECRAQRPDLVIADINMPDMDGIAAAA